MTKLEFKMRSPAQVSVESFSSFSVVLCGLCRTSWSIWSWQWPWEGRAPLYLFTGTEGARELKAMVLKIPTRLASLGGMPWALLGRDCDKSAHVWSKIMAIFP